MKKNNNMTTIAKIKAINELAAWARNFEEEEGVLTDAEATLLENIMMKFDELDVPDDVLAIIEHAVADPEVEQPEDWIEEDYEDCDEWNEHVELVPIEVFH